jgi:hypothetical protein
MSLLKLETHVLVHIMVENGFPYSSCVLLDLVPENHYLITLVILLSNCYNEYAFDLGLLLFCVVRWFDFSLKKERALEMNTSFLRKVV